MTMNGGESGRVEDDQLIIITIACEYFALKRFDSNKKERSPKKLDTDCLYKPHVMLLVVVIERTLMLDYY